MYIRSVQIESLTKIFSFGKVAEISQNKEGIENLYNGYKDLLDNYGGNGDKIKGVGAILSFGLKKIKITTEVMVEGKNIPITVSQLRTKRSNGYLMINMGTRIGHDELVYLQLSKKRASWWYPERSLLGETLKKESPTEKDLCFHAKVLELVKKQLTDFPRK